MQQPAFLRLPACQQLPLQRLRRLRGKSCQLLDARGGRIETSGKQQRRADQPDQLRRNKGQLSLLTLVEFQQQADIFAPEQMFEAEVLQQTDRHFELLRQQRLLERTLPVLFGAEPLARAAMPGSPGRGRFFTHLPGQWLEDPQPLDGVFPGLNEAAHVLQRVQPLRALTRTEKMLAQAGVEAWQMNQHLPDLNQLRWQGVEQLVLQIIEQRCRTPLLTRPRATIE
ncbi:hypothetical protein D9M71_275550 [compost metagenome]